MTLRAYTSLDTGSPVLTGDLYNRVKQILMACLVNGYGSKPAAGWTIGHQSADGNGFSFGNGDGFINFVNFTTNAIQVYIMESITDGSTALAGGVNRRSAGWADGGSSTERQTFYQPSGLTSTNPHWLLVADEKTVIFAFGGSASAADISSSNSGQMHYFGRVINAMGLSGPAEFVSLGGGYQVSSGYFGLSLNGGFYGASLRNPFTGLIDQGSLPRYGAANLTYSQGTVADPGKLTPSRLLLPRFGLLARGAGINGSTSYNATAGQLRGLVSEPTLCAAPLSKVLGLFGLSNTWQARVQPITFPNGKQYYPAFPNSSDIGCFISLDPDDWS